ncbi:hypothetical protein F9278_21445 [Streptomyces phaeolivaceus]|uniref:Secreted protein n=1 Tax=Streptomyces phaeolivaceus TaxID=2653200 RepID=A0A5P8K6C5_9ACTN|nr:hypothetical protein [Streptomyces phaeolivaceus]QFQ98328.1 hypothetical protein F9278_21445 [Streptomyces phaeolivaceus]
MRKSITAAGSIGAALLLTVSMAGSAYADSYRGCTTTGASGQVRISNWTDPTAKISIHGELTDTKSDDHHARMRLLTQRADGSIHYWPWRKNTGGVGTSTFDTTAEDSDRGIFEAGVEVARFEKDEKLNSCTDW